MSNCVSYSRPVRLLRRPLELGHVAHGDYVGLLMPQQRACVSPTTSRRRLSPGSQRASRTTSVLLHPELGAVLGAERFRREIKTAARLHYPHILQLYDSGEAAGLLYYTMPLVEGESCESVLPANNGFQVDPRSQLPERSPPGSTTPTGMGSCTATASPKTFF